MVKATKNKFQFGSAFEQLNKIVEQLEKGEIDLDRALQLYEDGLQLVTDCKKHLSQVENRVRVIREKYSAEPETDEAGDEESAE